jgi:hypothetical protein
MKSIYILRQRNSQTIGKILFVVLVLEIVELVPVPILHESVILRVLRLLLYFLFDLSHALTIHHGM